MEQDIRWEQRFSNFVKAFTKLEQAIVYIRRYNSDELQGEDEYIQILKEGVIQRFEYTHELSWNVMKDYLHYQCNPNVEIQEMLLNCI